MDAVVWKWIFQPTRDVRAGRMLKRTSKLSRREAMRMGVTSAVVTATVSSARGQNHVRNSIEVDGAIDGIAGKYLVDLTTGDVSKTAKVETERTELVRHFKLPIGQTLLDQSACGDLLVRTGEAECRLIALNSIREIKTSFHTVGAVTDASYSPDGTKIGFIESDDEGFRLVVMNANGSGRQVVNHVDQSMGMRGVSWSPCQKYVAVVAYDWEQLDETRGVPAPESHRIEVFAGSQRITRLPNSQWLDHVHWTTA